MIQFSMTATSENKTGDSTHRHAASLRVHGWWQLGTHTHIHSGTKSRHWCFRTTL